MTRPVHHTVVANGVRLHDVTAGGGDPVVLLHGWPQTCHEWRRVFPKLSERYTVVAPDLRGTAARSATGSNATSLAEDVYQLLRVLKLPAAHVVGHDLGGPGAYALAAAHPEAARTLSLIEVAGNVLEPRNVELALDGIEAVASSLGSGITFRRTTMLSEGTKNLVKGMTARGVRRLVCITGVGAGDSPGHGGFVYDYLIRPTI